MQIDVNGTRLWFDVDGPALVPDGSKMRQQPPARRDQPALRYAGAPAYRAGFGLTTQVNGTDLLVMWLDHLLVLSMLQHPSQTWSWGRFVLLHPAGNTDFADACARYRGLLADQSTFSSMTVEELLDADILPARTATALRKRYIPRDKPPRPVSRSTSDGYH